MKRFLKDLDTTIRQWLADCCETRMHKAKNINMEIFWHKLGTWILGL